MWVGLGGEKSRDNCHLLLARRLYMRNLMSKTDAVNSATFSPVSVVVFAKLRNFDRFVGKNKKIDCAQARRPIATCGSTQSPAA